MKALSIRQPWAWLIVRPDLVSAEERAIALRDHRMKPVENRTWESLYRGPLLIHAGQAMTRDDYDACYLFLSSDERTRDVAGELPRREELQRGGVIGRAELAACQREHESPFFCGPFGFVLANVQPMPFRAIKGALGLFNIPA